jgi:hypothetical protein
MRLFVVEVDEQTLDKIERKHGITIDEILKVCQSKRTVLRGGREGLHKAFGRTSAGRYILVVLKYHQSVGQWWIVTTRDMLPSERRMYGRK